MSSLVLPRRLGRRCAVGASLLASLARGCSDHLTGPAATSTPAARSALFDPSDPADAPDVLNLTIDADPSTGAGGSGEAHFYPTWTVVDVAASGSIEMTWTGASGYSGRAGQLDPGGRRQGYYHDICTGYGEVYAMLSGENGSFFLWDACYSLNTNFQRRMLVKDWLIIGRATDSRVQIFDLPWHACGVPEVGYPADCVTYSGTQTVTVNRLAANLTASADRQTVGAGTTVGFSAETDPVTFDDGTEVPLDVIRWKWEPDQPVPEGGARTQGCGPVRSCGTPIWESGTMYAEAFVNGQKQRVGAHVKVDESTYEVRIKLASEAMLRPSTRALTKTKPACSVGIDSQYRTMQVGVYKTSGAAVPNMDVRLVVDAEAETGGHVAHTGERPVGGLVLTADRKTTASQKEIVINTGASGVRSVSFEAPEFGGVHVITGRADAAREDEAKVTVGVSLEALAAGHWDRYGNGRDLHPEVWYGKPAMNSLLIDLADSFQTKFAKNIEYNDYTLRYGGRLETSGSWGGLDHCSHRWGNGIDVHTVGGEPLPDRQVRFIRATWAHLAGNDSAVVIENDHYHLKEWTVKAKKR